jgi:hypothetical protein
MKKIIYIALCLILLTSCSVQRQGNRKLKWCYAHGFLKNDTLVIRDTIKGYEIDTIFKSDSITLIDTFNVANGKDTVITIVKWKQKTIRQIIKKSDTVVVNKVPQIKAMPPCPPACTHKWWDNSRYGFWTGIIFTLAIGYLLMALSKRR